MVESIRTLDRYFGEWILAHFSTGLQKADQQMLQRLAQAASCAVALKHTCVDLAVYPQLVAPTLNEILDGITAADVQRLVTEAVSPLVASADGQRFWLQKYHAFEVAVVEALRAMQLNNRLEIITGGPGTGKTWTAAQRIKYELEKNPQCVIALAAPTGKAANNMMNALAKAGFDAGEFGIKGLTLHALLGLNGRSPKPRRDFNHPLSCDLLIVDEASMIDLPMMHRLLQAIPVRARLLLLGDKDQLASVEAGSVLAEICSALSDKPCIHSLKDSYRFRDCPEIGELATALNAGFVPPMTANTEVISHRLTLDKQWEPEWLPAALAAYGWIADTIADHADAETILKQQARFQLLCALRQGPYGVDGINAAVAKGLGHAPDTWYAGQPVMITQNDHERKLYNGDVGMVLNCDGNLKACFIVNGQLKMISRAQMPAYETCYAITVHKSQGSEYDHVMIVLPADVKAVQANPVLSRELVYTAVTRAKSRIDLWSGVGVLDMAASKTTQRMSGLQSLLQ